MDPIYYFSPYIAILKDFSIKLFFGFKYKCILQPNFSQNIS